MPKIHSLWRALEQGLFPFMMNEVAERKRPEMGMKPTTTLAGRLFCHALWLRPLPETPQNSVFSVMAQRVLTPQT